MDDKTVLIADFDLNMICNLFWLLVFYVVQNQKD